MQSGSLAGRLAPLKRLRELAVLFFRLGATSFGGPAGHIALMEHETVHKRGWLSREYFLDLLAATNLVPGPNATEMAIHIGFLRAGWPGLLVSGAAFILPSFAITLALAWAYGRFGSLPPAGAILYGVKPAVIAIIAMSAWRLGRSGLADRADWALLTMVLAGALLRLDDLLLLVAAGLAMVAVRGTIPWPRLGRSQRREAAAGARGAPRIVGRIVAGLCILGASGALLVALGLLWGRWLGGARQAQLFLYFLKVGSVLYGSGLVLYAFIERDVVANLHWLSHQQLVDAIAAGQITPGPVLSSATFIGYLIAGPPGAALATLGVFLPSFAIVALTGPWIPRLRHWRPGQAFLRGATVAALALILKTALTLARSALVDPWTILIALGGLAWLWRRRVDAVWVIAGGAAVGLLRFVLAGGP